MAGHGIYLEYAGFEHSCQPNAIGVFTGNVMQIRPIKDIDTNKEKITVDYCDGLAVPRMFLSENVKLLMS